MALVQQTEMQLWLDKIETWGQARSVDVQRDTCVHLCSLRDFLQRLFMHIDGMSSTTETMKAMPSLGQILGRLCWNPVVTADDKSRTLIFQCLWELYSEHPANALERKANQWIQKLLCQLTTEEDESPSDFLLKHLDLSPTRYHNQVLRKVVARLQEDVRKSCNSLAHVNERCSCERIVSTCVACVPLVTCPEVAPLLGALLQRPLTCVQGTLTNDFLDAVSSAYRSGSLSLENRAVVALWCHSLPSLEEAMLGLLESTVFADTPLSPQQLEQQIAQSLLPQACAQHCSIFLVASDIFRSVLKKREDCSSVRDLIQSFTSCFYRELTLLPTQTPLKAFFPHSPPNLLLPLLTQPPDGELEPVRAHFAVLDWLPANLFSPSDSQSSGTLAPSSEASGEARRRHLNWLSDSLRRLTEGEEEAGGSSSDGVGVVFEAWFVLVQCSHWVHEALRLLATTEARDCHPLLWLLTFYHHPTNRGHHRNQQLVCVRQVWEQMRILFSAAHLDPAEPLGALLAVISTGARRPSPSLILGLVVNCAVFFRQSHEVSARIVRTVAAASGSASEAFRVLSLLEHRLSTGSGSGPSSSDTHAASVRIHRLQNALATPALPPRQLNLPQAGDTHLSHSPS